MDRGLHTLTVENFGILGDVKLGPLGRLNVLVGPNGSGKSTILRVIQFLGDAARLHLDQAVADHGGMERITTRRSKPVDSPPKTHIHAYPRIHIQAIVTQHAHENALDEYVLRLIHRAGHANFYHYEAFTFKRTVRQGRRITLEGGKLHVIDDGRKERQRSLDKDAFGLAVLPQLGEDEGGTEIRKLQQLFTTFRVFDIDARAARTPADERGRDKLRADAANLAAFLHFLADEHAAVFERLADDARHIVPGLDDLVFRPVGGSAAAVAVEIRDHSLPGTTPLADASFGTVRALALLAMLHDPAPPLLTCVEEIDHGLHPYAFDRLVERLREASTRTQFLIATHSPALVNRLRPSELIVCERDPDNGLARIPAVDPQEVERIHRGGELGLGELWFSGSLGGVPK